MAPLTNRTHRNHWKNLMIKKTLRSLIAISLIPAATLAMAQGDDMKGMKGMDMPVQTSPTPRATHMAQGIVKAVNLKDGEVTIAHGPVKTLNWPAMTMAFMVHDKALFNKLSVGKEIQFEITPMGQGYMVSAVK